MTLQYADFAAWQRRGARGERGRARQLELLARRRLTGAPAGDRVADRLSETGGAGIPWRLGLADGLPAGRERLREFARGPDVHALHAPARGFKVLLHRWSGQRDLVVGTPVSARPHADLEGVVGLFINTLALRTDAEGNPTFAEFLTRVRSTAVDAFAHQDVPSNGWWRH